MYSQHINENIFLRVFALWICLLKVSGTPTTITNENPTTKNYTVLNNDNDVVLKIVHVSKNRTNNEKSTTLDSDGSTQLTDIAPTLQYDLDYNGTSKNANKHSKEEELMAKVQHYIKYLDSLDDPGRSLPFSGERKHVFGKDGRKKVEKRLAFLDEMLEDYDKRAWPTYGTNKSTRVTVNVYINTLGPVNAAQMEYGMDIYLRQMWNDPRLQLSKYGVHDRVTLNAEDIAPQIWKPDIFFKNVKQASFHKVTVPNKLIKIQPNGDVLYSMRITMRLACHMSFRHYPLDCQRCQLILGSYAQTTDQVVIHWQKKHPIVIEQALELPEFDVTEYSHSSFIRSIDTGAFSFLNVTFVLVRQNGFHLIQTYMPTFLIVMISWVSFWLNVDATPARVTLGVTTLLTLTTVAYGVRMQLPPVSYIKAIDIWIGACSVMVFGALLEFTLVNYLSRSKLNPGEIKHSLNIFHWNKKIHMAQDIEGAMKEEEELARNLKRARYVDRFCRILFPVAFLIFNVVYWLYYLYVPDKAV